MDLAGWLAVANVTVLTLFGVLSVITGRARPWALSIYPWLAVLLLSLHFAFYLPGEPSVLSAHGELSLVGPMVLGWFEGMAGVRAVLLLLLVLAFSQILREDFGSRFASIWIGISAMAILFSLMFPYIRVWSYHGGRTIFLVGGAVLLYRAVRERHPMLLALSSLCAGWLVSDIIKVMEKISAGTTFVTNIQVIQRYLDPTVLLLGHALLVWAVLQPEWSKGRERLETTTTERPVSREWISVFELSSMLMVPEREALDFVRDNEIRMIPGGAVHYGDVLRALGG